MIDLTLGAGQSFSSVFYDDLDTVRFGIDVNDKTRKARSVTACGDLMMGMIIENIAPILSQAQSYDNQLVLTLISPEGNRAAREDRINFLRLASAGLVRVGLMEDAPAADPPDGERYTLMNIFRTSLANPDFVLSGWPELNSDLDLRQEIHAFLGSPGGRISAHVPAAIAARIEGLREFDHALRSTPQGIKIVRRARSPLTSHIDSILQALDPDSCGVREAAERIIEQARHDEVGLNNRSNWYTLIGREEQIQGIKQGSPLRLLRDIVDLAYNAMASESLKDEGMSLSAAHRESALSAAQELAPGHSPGQRWADLTLAPGTGSWLRWSDVPALLAELRPLSPDARLRELKTRHSEQIVEYETTHSWGISARIALPDAVGVAMSGFATSLITSATPEQAAVVGLLTGIATIVARTPVARAFREGDAARLAERVMSRDERNTIRTGAANWLDRMRGNQWPGTMHQTT